MNENPSEAECRIWGHAVLYAGGPCEVCGAYHRNLPKGELFYFTDNGRILWMADGKGGSTQVGRVKDGRIVERWSDERKAE